MKSPFLLPAAACCALGLLLAACGGSVPATPVATLDPGCTSDGRLVRDEAPSEVNVLPIAFQVYLPPCYDSQPGRSYPVLYLLHGRGSSEASWFGAGMDVIAESHIRSGDVPPFLLVTPRMVEEDREVDFMLRDVIPYVEGHYRVLGDRRHRAVGGGSLGAIFAVRLALQHPDQFASVAAFGGAAVSGEEEVLRGWIDDIPRDQRPRVLIDIGQQDTMLFSGQILMDLLDEADYPYRFNSEEGGHTYVYWAGNLDEFALAWIAEDWR